MASPGPCTGLNPQFRDHPDLKQLVLHNVTLTGKTLGCGSYGSVEEVAIPGALCAAKKIHDFLSQEDPNWLEKEKADENIQKFVAECKMMGRLRHPNVVQFLGIWFSPKESTLPALYLVMEKMLTSLHDLLEPDTPKPSNAPKPYIPLSVKCSILCDIAQGIAYLHNQSPPVVHRDLSARNVLLNSAMVAKIADMGMARFLPERKNTTMTKAPGASVYMPPEALEDKSKYDRSIDLFSLGVVAIFVLAQEFPDELKAPTYTDEWKGLLVARTELERREKYTKKIYSAFPKTHALIHLMESCLKNSPKARPTIDQALELLDQAVAGIQDFSHLQINKLQLLQMVAENSEILQQQKRYQLELDSMQQKCDAWREEVETLSPLRDEVAQLHQENARLQQELTHVTEDGKQKEQEKEKNTAELGGRMGGRLVNVEGESETSVQLTVCDQQKNEFRIHNQQRSEDRDSDYANDPESIELPPLPPKRSTSLKPKPHDRMETWFIEGDKDHATELLKHCANGTFLCRKSSQLTESKRGGFHTHTIDVMYDGVKHIKVFQDKGMYRVSSQSSFNSLKELVLHFSENALLLQHPGPGVDTSLSTTLQFPVFSEDDP